MIIPDNFYHEIDKRTIRNLKRYKEIGKMPISRFFYNTEHFEIISCNEKEVVLKCNHKHYEEYIVRCYFDDNNNKMVATTNTENNATHVCVRSKKDTVLTAFFNASFKNAGFKIEKKVNNNSKRQILLSFLNHDLNNTIKIKNVVFLKRSKIFKVKFEDANSVNREITYNSDSLEVNYNNIIFRSYESDIINFRRAISEYLNIKHLRVWIKKQYRFKKKLLVRDCHIDLCNKINKELSDYSRFMYYQNSFKERLTNIIAVYKLKDYDLLVKDNGVKIILKNKKKTLSLNLQFRKVKGKFIMDFRDFNKDYENYYFDYSIERVERKEKEYKPKPIKPKTKTVRNGRRLMKRKNWNKKSNTNTNNSNSILTFDKSIIESSSKDEVRNKIISHRLYRDEFIC